MFGHAHSGLRGGTIRPAFFKATTSVVQQPPLGPQNTGDKCVLIYSAAIEGEHLPDYRCPSLINSREARTSDD